MKARTRVACVSAAVFAALYTGSLVRAADLTWDGDPSTGGVQDISGNWNTTTPNWFNGTTNVLWSNATPDSAFLGTGGAFNNATAPHNLTVTEPITVQNLMTRQAQIGLKSLISDKLDVIPPGSFRAFPRRLPGSGRRSQGQNRPAATKTYRVRPDASTHIPALPSRHPASVRPAREADESHRRAAENPLI